MADFLAGMTDTYAVREHRRLFDHTPDWLERIHPRTSVSAPVLWTKMSALRSEKQRCRRQVNVSDAIRHSRHEPNEYDVMNIFADFDARIKNALQALD